MGLNINGIICNTIEELEIQITDLPEDQKQLIRNDFHGVPNEVVVAPKLRILNYLLDGMSVSDFRSIDHNTMLKETLSCVETFGQTTTDRGLLLKKTYKSIDGQEIFEIHYSYTKNQYGIFTHQQLVLQWFCEDESFHPLYKDKGHEPLTTKRSKEIVRNRRKTIMAMLENNVESLLIASGAGNEGLALGRSLLLDLSPHMVAFENSGVIAGVVAFMEDSASHAKYPFLLANISQGVLVKDYVINFMSFE